MPKADGTFRPVGDSDVRMHGSAAVLVSGFEVDEQKALRSLMDTRGLEAIPTVYIVEAFLDCSLAELSAMGNETRAGETAKLPRAIVMSGFSERQLHALMDGYREASLPRPHWASVTPTSALWSIKRLLIELMKEREALRLAKIAEQERAD
jgi:hypothetical protein